ncbi:hypothetical protein [Saccharopolyspora phatthalungensis]|uniref:Uncharacterized protein n=1 Tax=Saccharopolyspora phatthalungensis TaxID=664693 RepID=A0A840QA98_9PSEU|nr:hypothetical protein [Saccharopolyspora phatthalungensis]MBB5155489.1 hypothetical protein [Saccharopolyspora phatthalungensis]
MAHNSFTVDVGALQSAESGIRDAVAVLGEMAGWGMAASGKQGKGLVEYLLQSGDIGHGELTRALLQFGESWEFGVRYLVEDGYAAADALGEARVAYQQLDAEAEQRLVAALRED